MGLDRIVSSSPPPPSSAAAAAAAADRTSKEGILTSYQPPSWSAPWVDSSVDPQIPNPNPIREWRRRIGRRRGGGGRSQA
jgi:hypothetical protein